jgi:hypothetical protein
MAKLARIDYRLIDQLAGFIGRFGSPGDQPISWFIILIWCYTYVLVTALPHVT